jgi:hypothetical protein
MHSHRRASGPLPPLLLPLLPPLTLALALALAAAPCHAALGRAPSDFGNTSVRHARALAASGVTTSGVATPGVATPGTATPSWDVRVSVLDNGTTVHEYATGGVVFAVAWNGPFLPDLRKLLGPYFGTLTDDTARRPKAGNSQVRIRRPDVTIESGGHMRAYAGRAWVNGLLPAGFDTEDIE